MICDRNIHLFRDGTSASGYILLVLLHVNELCRHILPVRRVCWNGEGTKLEEFVDTVVPAVAEV